jgi:hypothetical protein
MAEFLVERYVARESAGTGWSVERVRAAAQELSREGSPVRHLRSIFVPEDETCFDLFEAGSIELVRAVVGRAALPFERIALALSQEPERTDPAWDSIR